uniref:Uncharacterized protein n=1 Tax=Romanomermis culicivorax TaxID=13658 RepID=A0A915LBK0_ROMCU
MRRLEEKKIRREEENILLDYQFRIDCKKRHSLNIGLKAVNKSYEESVIIDHQVMERKVKKISIKLIDDEDEKEQLTTTFEPKITKNFKKSRISKQERKVQYGEHFQLKEHKNNDYAAIDQRLVTWPSTEVTSAVAPDQRTDLDDDDHG